MRLSTTVLLSGLVLLAATSGVAQNPVYGPPSGNALAPIPNPAPGMPLAPTQGTTLTTIPTANPNLGAGSTYLTPIPGTAPSNQPTIPGTGNIAPEFSNGQYVPNGQYGQPNPSGKVTTPTIDPSCATNEKTFECSLDALGWNLLPAVDQPLAYRARDFTEAFNTGSQNFLVAPGARFRVAYLTDEGNNFEGEFFGISNWQASNAIFDNAPGLYAPGDLGNPAFARNYTTGGNITTTNPLNPPVQVLQAFASQTFAMQFRTDASIRNVEVNLAMGEKDSNIKYLLGARFVKFDEHFRMSSTSNMQDAINPANTGTFTSHYDIRTVNEAFGLNLGVRSRHYLWNCWQLEQVAKIAVFANSARQNQIIGDINDRVILRNIGSEAAPTALLTEYNFSLIRPINERWSWRFGYDVVWLNGFARATDQLDFRMGPTAGSAVQLRAGTLMQGIHIGMESSW